MKLLSSKKSQNKEFGFDILPGRPIICAGRDAKIFSRRQMLTKRGFKRMSHLLWVRPKERK